MPAPHILICFHDFARGGTERVALTLARQWLDSGRTVTILCGTVEGGVFDQVDPRIQVVELDPPVRRSPVSRLKLGPAMAARLAELRPDVVFLPGNFHFVLAHALKRAAPAVPVVAKVSNPLLPTLPRGLSDLARSALSAYVKPVDALVYMAPELASRGSADLPGSAVEVIAEPNLPDAYAALARIGPEDVPLVLAIGRMEPQKNLTLALRTFAELRNRQPAKMLVLGEGAERAKLEALARKLGIAQDVAMPGYSNETPYHLARASALLLTSRYEGYPAVVVEALAADLPVVSTDCTPALQSMLPSAVHGRIVAKPSPAALADALQEVFALPFTSGGIRPSAVTHNRSGASADAYLALFDRLAE